MKRRGFTLVELMTVVGILSILMTLVVSSVSGSMKTARENKAKALCVTVQSALATYYAQKEKWPEPIGTRAINGGLSRTNDEGVDGRSDPDKYILNESEVRAMVKALVDEVKKGNPLIDVSTLFVSREPGHAGSKAYGLDFFQAVRGDKRTKKRMKTADMYFGYPDKETGHFRSFKMVYSIPTDELMVFQQ